jgi:hypothetical protein
MGFRVLDSFADVGISDGGKVRAKVGFADSLRIANLLVENVALLILPDELFSYPTLNYTIHGIIGFPVMYQMKEIVISGNESITVPIHPTKRNLRNLFLDGLSPVVQFEANSDTVLFLVDTGYGWSEFSERYFSANSEQIIEKATKRMQKLSGRDGIFERTIYVLKNLDLKIGGQGLTLTNMQIVTDKNSVYENRDGILGQNVLMRFKKRILNFEDMYLAFED